MQFAETQEALVQTVVQGMSITFALSFVVLLFATGNVILALLSIVTIAGIVTSVLGIGCRLIQVPTANDGATPSERPFAVQMVEY